MSDLAAGKRLNRVVAETLMAWSIIKRGRRVLTGLGDHRPGREISGFSGKADARKYIATVCPAYSEDENAAFRVVDRMIEDGFIMDLKCDSGIWTCVFDDLSYQSSAVGNTAPLAICRAALRAMGKD